MRATRRFTSTSAIVRLSSREADPERLQRRESAGEGWLGCCLSGDGSVAGPTELILQWLNELFSREVWLTEASAVDAASGGRDLVRYEFLRPPRHSRPGGTGSRQSPGFSGAQRVKRVPTQLGINASGNVAASFWIARQPVQWVATMTSGAISANAAQTAGINGSKIGPLR
jgi:hypothetical protein